MNSSHFLMLILTGASCLYLFVVVWSFRASLRRDFSTPWLFLPLSGAAISGVTLVFGVPVLQAPALFKLLELGAHLCNILLIWAIAGKLMPTNRLPATLLYAWNPLVLIELAFYANTAGVVICLLLLALMMLLVDTPSSFFARIVSPFRRGGSGVDEGRGRLRRPPGWGVWNEGTERGRRFCPPGWGIWNEGTERGRRKRPLPTQPNPRPYEIAALVLIALAMRINFMTLLIAPLLLWFMARHRRGVGAALMGFTWRALLVLAIFIVVYLPGWQGSATFLAITNGFHLFDFANSPLSLVVMPVRSFFSFVAQRADFPPLMQPAQAADMTVLATSFFLFALLYVREMGRVRARLVGATVYKGTKEGTRVAQAHLVGETRAAQAPPPILSATPSPTKVFITGSSRGGGGWEGWWGRLRRPRSGAISLGFDGSHGDISQQNEDEGTGCVTSEESQGNEDKHQAPASAPPRPLSLQDEEEDDSEKLLPYDALFTGWAVVIVGYIVLAATVFLPGYIMWGVWVVALRRFDTLSIGVLLLSCSALLYYPLQQLASTSTGFLVPLCVFGIPLVYLIVQRWIPAGRIERKNVLT